MMIAKKYTLTVYTPEDAYELSDDSFAHLVQTACEIKRATPYATIEIHYNPVQDITPYKVWPLHIEA